MSQSHIGDLCKICLSDLFFDDKFVVFHREKRGHSDENYRLKYWPAIVWEEPTCNGYGPRLTTDAGRGAKTTGGTFAGAALRDGRRRKHETYPELFRSRRCNLVVLGLEVGGKWSQEAASFITLLAQHEARQAPPILQHSITTALIARWSSLLTHAAQQTFAASLVDTPQTLANHTNTEGNEPTFSQLVAEAPPKSPSQPAPTTVSTKVPKGVWIYALPKAHLDTGQYKTVSRELDLKRKKERGKKKTFVKNNVGLRLMSWFFRKSDQCE